MSLKEDSLTLHEKNKGKISIQSKVSIETKEDLSLAYSPGVAEPCLEIAKDKTNVYKYTNKGNLVAVVSNGTAVLGLGDIGAEASMPVMEGKAILFKKFANVDAFPICINEKDIDAVINIVKALEPTFGGINLEDISAPACFEIERRLKKEMNIPVFHDDQHGTAVVTLAGLVNSLKIVKKKIENIKVVMNGAGAAGIAIAKILHHSGVKNIIMCDRTGAIYEGRPTGMNAEKDEISKISNQNKAEGKLEEIIKGADVFIGVSVAGSLTSEMVSSMNKDAIIFALANPNPEILPEEAIKAGARIVATGRSDFPNQVNNVLAFPGIFRGALDARATDITEEMKKAAAYAIANLITEEELNEKYVIPDAFDERVSKKVAESVYKIAKKEKEHV